eukprot:CAMPEP_0184478290 /NCGR_PEP_ID=MMETSP0113_2-20130426/353_1 /TAXON_ID=91329 /ORGANISM="Norrisiella sphaerica, Strain BC52" /LENGTH=706 /DNA_ID=CAMNT_0026856023 /DNA_START=63 /DNA_END=2183 /DNA_ORIENTATION=+
MAAMAKLISPHKRAARKPHLSINTDFGEVKRVDLGGYKHDKDSLQTLDIPDIFLISEVKLLNDAVRAGSEVLVEGGIETCTEALKGCSTAKRKKCWTALLGCALGLCGNKSERVQQQALEFCETFLLGKLSDLTTGLNNAYEDFCRCSSSDSNTSKSTAILESIDELRVALSLVAVTLTCLRTNRDLPVMVMKARVLKTREEKKKIEEEKLKKVDDGEEKAEVLEESRESLLRLLVRMLGDRGKSGDRSFVYELPLKKLLLVFDRVLEILIAKLDAKETEKAQTVGSICRQFDEWDLRDAAARMSRKFSPVIVNEVEGKLTITTFDTLPKACKEALQIMEKAVERNRRRRPIKNFISRTDGDEIPPAAYFCRETIHLLERLVDGIITSYLGGFGPSPFSVYFPHGLSGTPQDPDFKRAEAQRHTLIMSQTATQILLKLLSFLRRGGERAASAYVRAMLQKRNVMLIVLRLLKSRHSPTSLASPPKGPKGSNFYPLAAPSCFAPALLEWVHTAQVSGVQNPYSRQIWPRGIAISLTALRLIQKLTKRSPLHVRTLVKLGGLDTLESFLNVEEENLSYYALKLLKSGFKHAPSSWRIRRLDVVSRVYQRLRLDLLDDWYIPVQIEGKLEDQEKHETSWRNEQLAALKRRREDAQKVVTQRFPAPLSKRQKKNMPDAAAYIEKLFDEVHLPKDFEQSCEEWFKNYMANR